MSRTETDNIDVYSNLLRTKIVEGEVRWESRTETLPGPYDKPVITKHF